MTEAEQQRLAAPRNAALSEAMQVQYLSASYGQVLMRGMLGMQLGSTFNYRKFSKAGEYRKSELRRIVMMIAENGYIRRVK